MNEDCSLESGTEETRSIGPSDVIFILGCGPNMTGVCMKFLPLCVQQFPSKKVFERKGSHLVLEFLFFFLKLPMTRRFFADFSQHS